MRKSRERNTKWKSTIKEFVWDTLEIILLASWIGTFVIGICKLFLDYFQESDRLRDRQVVRVPYCNMA